MVQQAVLSKGHLHELKQAKDILDRLSSRYNVSTQELLETELLFPASIFSKKLTVLHSIVKYLKENKECSLSDISRLIGRDQRNVWRIYHDARGRSPNELASHGLLLPVSLFSNEITSAQESIVCYLKETKEMTLHEIALLLKRDDRTIWTAYHRARKKHGKKK